MNSKPSPSAAWDFIALEGGGLELAAINPGAIFGPVLAPDLSASIGLVAGLLSGSMAGSMPRLSFSVVDVRDVADLHLLAMDSPLANGERFIAAAGDAVWLADVARVLRDHLGAVAINVPTAEIPDDVLRAAATIDSALERVAREVGKLRRLSSEKARRVLGWEPRSTDEAILATAESLLKLGLA